MPCRRSSPRRGLEPERARAAQALARRLAQTLRERPSGGGREGLVQGLLQEYSLSSQEGVALMCLAEALLRIPDPATRDALIRDKISAGQWHEHLGKSPSLFVNAATWALLLTGKLVATHSESGLSNALARIVGKGGEPLIRKSVDRAMRLMGEQFVTGETIDEALANARSREAQGFRHSFDMLGEAALTAADAARYLAAYEHAIDAIGVASAGRGIVDGPGISIKLSALHPRYQRAQIDRVHAELYPVLRALALRARRHDIGLNIDAEEADRLELSLDLLERLCDERELAGWNGIGFVVQAYQKRCPFVIDAVVDLARRSGHRLMVRLVKGAYWDSEIKRAQIDGLDDYPVYTRKAYTDVAYLACARKLLAAPDAVFPQFATHNAHTLAAIVELAGADRFAPGQYEFQCLHGMGEPLYDQVVGGASADVPRRPCRIYAPVGTHETLLAYLVRRLLENGANTSFVHRIADPDVPLDELVEDPVQTVERMAVVEGAVGLPHPAIALPRAIYGDRLNSRGIDLASDDALAALAAALQQSRTRRWSAAPLVAAPEGRDAVAAAIEVRNPAEHGDVVGDVVEASADDVERALASAAAGASAWAATPAGERAAMLERAADGLEAELPLLLGLLAREAGKTMPNGVAEVREAIDFLRFYAAQARRDLGGDDVAPLGPVVCISPWNFPLAIFTGQIAACARRRQSGAREARRADAARRRRDGAQAPRRRRSALRAAVPAGARRDCRRGARRRCARRRRDVHRIDRRRAAAAEEPRGAPRPSRPRGSARRRDRRPERDAGRLVGARRAGRQRRDGLCVRQRRPALLGAARPLRAGDGADRVVEMLQGAMAESRIGRAERLAVDVGPVIDGEARAAIESHVETMRQRGHRVFRAAGAASEALARGTFVVPTLIELDRVAELEREIFGPVLHVVRFRRRDLAATIAQINATGYGLTFGVQSRIDETIAAVVAAARAGNVYVNRNMVGAVVGVQPFGGEGLSGTGPKAGGPLYLLRLLARTPADAMARALAASGEIEAAAAGTASTPLVALQDWAELHGDRALADVCVRFAAQARVGAAAVLAGPTGERNVYSLQPRDAVLCLAEADGDRFVQLAAVLAVGSRAVWPAAAESLRRPLPSAVRERIDVVADWAAADIRFDAVLHHGNAAELLAVLRVVAERPGPIVGVEGRRPGETVLPLERLVVERAVSINTAAAGGNATLMTLE
jgi:RHH-type proline utilization regulon transcriptional repressor/proline dehydrogenase/delta 1-pyrroline-5-carboxylate dehydrogenase